MGSENAMIPGKAEARRALQAVQGVRLGVLLGFGVGLAGCSSVPAALNPVEWWHGLQGGKIAEERPAPPGANDPYPNLGTVPARPAPSDPKLRQQIADALIADRGNAQHDAAGVQLIDPSSPNAAPGLFGRGSVRPPAAPQQGGASASFPGADAATAAPPSSPPPMATERASGVARAPVGPVQSATLEQPEAERPALPTAPPAPANLPGAPASAPIPVDRPATAMPSTTIANPAAPSVDAAPTDAPATSASAPVSAPAAQPGRAVGVPFAVGSAVVPRPSVAALRQLATRRGSASIAVTGFGEATGPEAVAQSAALSLALARAQAVAGALTSFGVPASAIKVDAEAAGRGAAARLIE